jgi:hypothetical protein
MKTLIIGAVVFGACFGTWRGRNNPHGRMGNRKAQIHLMFVAKDVLVRYFPLDRNPNPPVNEFILQILSQNSGFESSGPGSLDEGGVKESGKGAFGRSTSPRHPPTVSESE